MRPDDAHHRIETNQCGLRPDPTVLLDEFKAPPAPFSAKTGKRHHRFRNYSTHWMKAHPISVLGNSQTGKLENIWSDNDDKIHFNVFSGQS